MNIHLCFRMVLIIGVALLSCASQPGDALASPQGALQDAINAAEDGATIDISAGAYSESLVINKSLTLKGTSSATTILQPAGAGQRVIQLESGHNLRLENLTVTGANLGSSGGGGGIYVQSGSTLTLNSCVVSNNTASYGGGVYQEGTGGYVVANNSVIQGNTASFHGGGMYVGGSATLTDTTLTNNTASVHGGGMSADGSVTLTGGVVSNNHATNGNGGGVNLNEGLTINGTQFLNNSAGDSGGGLTQWNAGQSVTISGATFSGNTAKLNGGGAYIRFSYLTVTNTSFSSNTVDSGGKTNSLGGGLYAGGGLYGSGLTFTANSASCTSCSYTDGGGLYVSRPATGPSSVVQSTFEDNLAWHGSGIGSDDNVQLTLSRSTFKNNGDPLHGGYGGGVDAYWVNGDQLLFQGNSVLNGGGGLRAIQATLTRSRFIGNSSGSAAGGGGLFVYDNFNGSNLLFADNISAYHYGAAMRVDHGPAVLWHATIAQPSQGSGPAIYINPGATMELKNSILTNYNPGVYLAGTLTEDYNLFYNNTADVAIDSGGIVNHGGHSTGLLNPLFANPAGGNYHLQPNSPAIGTGTNLGVSNDLDGLPRTNRWDKGAYQFYWMQYLPVTRK